MPAVDKYHQAVKNALVKAGWTVTDEPLRLPVGRRNLYVDLAAERVIAAFKGTQKIAVEVKTFTGRSEMADMEQAVGQFVIYQLLLQQREPDRTLYVAVPIDTLNSFFEEVIGETVQKSILTHLIAFDPNSEEIIRWLPEMEATTH